MTPERIGIGVDVGGTKIEALVGRARGGGEIDTIGRTRIATRADEGYEAIVARLAGFVREVASGAGLDLAAAPIGIGMPGGVTRRGGLVKNSNTTCLNGRPFRQDVTRALGREVRFENDANCFALAEARLGAGVGHEEGAVFGVIMGTGVGGGLVLRGRLWPGLQGIAGEWGHLSVRPDLDRPCYCGQRGCVEVLASGSALEAEYERRAGARLSAAAIAERAAADPHAAAALEQLLDAYGRGLASVIDVLDPSVVVLGGGLSNLACLYDEGWKRVCAHVFNDELATPIVPHALGDSAGVFGALLLALEPASAAH